MPLNFTQTETETLAVTSITGDVEPNPKADDLVLLASGKLAALGTLPAVTAIDVHNLDDIPDSSSRLAMAPEERQKLAGIEAAAVAAGMVGDAHALTTGNPHGTTADEVGAAPLVHSHPDIASDIAGKAPAVHQHILADTSGLGLALDGKAPTAHSHAMADVSGLVIALAGKAPTAHTQAISSVTGLQAALDAKVPSVALGKTVATLGADGKVPAAQLPPATAGYVGPLLKPMTANGTMPGPAVWCTGVTALTFADPNNPANHILYIWNADPALTITCQAPAGVAIIGSTTVAPGTAARFMAIDPGTGPVTQVSRLLA